MKQLIVLPIALIITLQGISQKVTYTADDLGETGDIYYTTEIEMDSTEWIPADSIDPQLWNFSSIETDHYDSVEIMSKNAFSELDSLPESTQVIQNQDESYTILNLEGDTLFMLGMLIDFGQEILPVLLDPAPPLFSLPLTIGDGGYDSLAHSIAGTPEEFGLSIPFHDSIRFDMIIKATTLVEDTGTVVTWQYSYPAFKVSNTTILEVDLWAKPSIGDWYLFQDNVEVDSAKGLQFFTPEYGIPVVEVQMNWNNEINSMRMIDEAPQNIVPKSMKQFTMYPNPVQSGMWINFNKLVPDVRIYDITGRLLLQHNKPTQKINLPDMPEGIYLLRSKSLKKTERLIVK